MTDESGSGGAGMSDAYRQYFEAMPCYLTVQNRHFRIIDANRRFREGFGDWEGRQCYQVYKGRSEICEICPVERTFHDGRPHRSEERVRRLDGTEVSVLVEAMPIRNGSGEIVAVMEMSTDITEIKRLQNQLKSSQERYRLLFEDVPCHVSIQDRDLRVIEANAAFQEDFGSCLGRKCYEVYLHRDEPCWPCPVMMTFEDGQPHDMETVVTSLTGARMNVLVTTAPIRNARGDITSVMEMSANITQVRQLEDKLTSLGLLIGSVSHGLKGLLNGLTGGMYLVDSGFKKDDRSRVDRGWETVRRNVSRIKSMVSDILYYAKEREPNWEPIEAAALARQVLTMLEPRAKSIEVDLAAAIDEDVGEFEADPQAIRSLLVNLVENSLDACRLDRKKTEHRVTLRLEGSEDDVLYVIEDNGIGMDRETREKAFSLFFSSKGMEGTGLGLFIANKIAAAHGGTIELESESDVGTRFLVRLPRRRPERHETGQSPNEAEVDDD
jgi:PAS domain S-box-containing protein